MFSFSRYISSQARTVAPSCRLNRSWQHYVSCGYPSDDRCSGHSQVLRIEEAQSGLSLLSGGHAPHLNRMDLDRPHHSRLWVLAAVCDVYTHSPPVCTKGALCFNVSQLASGQECVE